MAGERERKAPGSREKRKALDDGDGQKIPVGRDGRKTMAEGEADKDVAGRGRTAVDPASPELLQRVLKQDLVNVVRKAVEKKQPLSARERELLLQAAAGDELEDSGTVTSIADLCRALGISRPTFYRYAKRQDAPAKATNGTFDVPAWRVYLRAAGVSVARSTEGGGADEDNEGFATPEEKRAWEVKVLRERWRVLQIEADLLEKRTVDRTEVQRWIQDRFGGLRKRLMGIPGGIAPRLVGKTRAQIDELLKQELAKTLNQFARDHEKRSKAVA